MTSTFAIIVNDEISYVSDKQEEPIFEVVIFAHALLKKLSKKNWNLHKIILNPIQESEPIKLLIHRKFDRADDLDVLYCMKGNFVNGSKLAYDMLHEFENCINEHYQGKELVDIAQNNNIVFTQVCEETSYILEQNYGKKSKQNLDSQESFEGDPALLYAGLSCQGLPIVSKLFAINLIDSDQTFSEDDFNKRLEFLETTISGQLATISMNSFIRAKAYVEEIQLVLDEQEQQYGFINFNRMGANDQYTLELFTMGVPSKSNEFISRVKNTAENKFECLQKPFAGELKPYSALKEFFNNLEIS